ncbi:putative HTH-type transcriptional regulator/MT2039 [Brevundimonas sp. SH203]|uniref:LysR family transcriptional regulator ArgP n=1 Tax=Brevundimonas sp. SH203 TaxID=345167 RepID=UPI0009D10C3C|nr:LysR family transcriptional regulator ArgP [Brevundimonas sp. SH203]GAW42147.1 putative HTH-type transcriptional regulator/MT2039 [Brevundimonas sp. SH203]
MLDYAALAALSAVVRTGAFDAAAARLAVTPSAVSQRIKGLEERLGLPLIVRSTPCRATEAGARLVAHFDQVSLLEHDLLQEGAPWAAAFGGPRPTVRLAVNSDSLATWIPAAVARFSASAETTLALVLDDENHTAERLRTGEVIAAVTTNGKPAPGCRVASLGRMRYVATASPAFAGRWFADGVTQATLAPAPVLRFDQDDRLQDRWAAQAVGRSLSAPTYWAPSTQGMLDLTLAGVAWSMTPETIAAPLVAAGRLVRLKPETSLDVPLFWQHLRIASRTLEGLTRAVREETRHWLI